IDGVLLRSSTALPRAHAALSFLQRRRIPFVLLTNGGGKHEAERVAELSRKLDVPLDEGMIVQSHTPFREMTELWDKTVLVVGGDGGSCREVARKRDTQEVAGVGKRVLKLELLADGRRLLRYGFKSVVTPADLIVAHPEIWPFARVFAPYYCSFAQPLPAPILPSNPAASLKIDAIYVYSDPRDWSLDTTIILDLLLSHAGILGTLSRKNDDASLPNRGYQQDGQPPLYFSNPDLWWAAAYHLPRLGQGGFRAAFEGVWAAVTGGERRGVELLKTVIGKPFAETYEFAEKRLRAHRQGLLDGGGAAGLKSVYMVGDNPGE
ncbi:hypothetical protein LTR04_004704, partial [Oleoguttula sp. CCFEE 6159]